MAFPYGFWSSRGVQSRRSRVEGLQAQYRASRVAKAIECLLSCRYHEEGAGVIFLIPRDRPLCRQQFGAGVMRCWQRQHFEMDGGLSDESPLVHRLRGLGTLDRTQLIFAGVCLRVCVSTEASREPRVVSRMIARHWLGRCGLSLWSCSEWIDYRDMG